MAMVQPKSARYRLWATHAALLAFVAAILFPLLMVVSISFREGNFATGSLFPENPTLEHWSLALGIPYTHEDGSVTNPPFPVLLWLWNSVKIALVSSALILLLSTTSAYAFARMRFGGKAPILKGMLIFQMFPPVLSLVAIYALFDQLGQHVSWLGVNSHGAVIVASLGGMALHIWTIKGYFESIDASLEEAAIVDGATTWQAFFHILLPMSVPILPGGGVHPRLHHQRHRIPHRLGAADGRGQAHPLGRRAAVPLPAELPVGRLRRRGGTLRPAHHRRVPLLPEVDRRWPDRRRGEGLTS